MALRRVRVPRRESGNPVALRITFLASGLPHVWVIISSIEQGDERGLRTPRVLNSGVPVSLADVKALGDFLEASMFAMRNCCSACLSATRH